MLASLLANRHFGGTRKRYTLPNGRRLSAANAQIALDEFFESLIKPPPKKVLYKLSNARSLTNAKSLKTTANMVREWVSIPSAKPRMSVPRRLTLTKMVSTKKTPAKLLGRFWLKGRKARKGSKEK